jgi:hypothetical protein
VDPHSTYSGTDNLVFRVISELKGRFDHFMKTGDDSKMPGDIIQTIFRTVRAHYLLERSSTIAHDDRIRLSRTVAGRSTS